jgi:prepilin-type N-terminal cleavage/methylation domain-containing protein
MVRNAKGFTIIELVVVIVILGILAAVAFPKFQDLSGSAKLAVVQGGAAAFKSAAVITYAKFGVVQTKASVEAQTTAEGVSFTGTCPSVTAQYTTDTSVSIVMTLDTTICNG